MRVAIFTDNDFNKVNGVTTTLTAVIAHAPADVRARIYTAAGLGSDAPDYLALPSFAIPIPFYREMRMYLPKWRQYLNLVREDSVDLIHLTTPGPLGLTALWVARKTGLPLVGSYHTDLGAYTSILSGSPRLGHWMDDYMRWLYGRCRHVLVPSVATRELLLQGGLPWERLAIWPRGVDTDLFTPAKRSASLRRAWGADDERPIVLYVGRVSREKGLELLPAIVERLQTMSMRFRLVIAGDGPLRPWLAERLPDAVFCGSVGREQVAEIFASADVFAFPSRTDTAGNVVLEAQASGLPVIVSAAGGPSENMMPGMTGLVCGGVDGRSWGNSVALLLRNVEQRHAMSAAARSYGLSRRWDKALEPLFETYRRVCRPSTAATGAVRHAA
jgi:glycosyltransferase involved in cell wall biosynthesis